MIKINFEISTLQSTFWTACSFRFLLCYLTKFLIATFILTVKSQYGRAVRKILMVKTKLRLYLFCILQRVSYFSLSRSPAVPDEGFLCGKLAVHGETIKRSSL